jgi:hypothetical protein
VGRYYWDKKPTAESSYVLSIYWLRKNGYLSGDNTTGEISWTNSMTGKTTSVLFEVHITNDPHLKLIYSLTDREGNTTDYKEEISLLTTFCNFGGVRYWFACPSCCQKRVGILYLVPGDIYFRCRYCNNITYWSRNRCRIESFGETWRQIDKLRTEIKRWTWRGRPTRKVRRLRTLERKAGVLGGYAMARFDKLNARLRY